MNMERCFVYCTTVVIFGEMCMLTFTYVLSLKERDCVFFYNKFIFFFMFVHSVSHNVLWDTLYYNYVWV